ncbi:kinase [Alkalicoccus luteus]|uniref:kinase n=1 Tax=Alkalicoccus luteus TaxID=1237094 RepID=UPI004033A190
MTYLQLEADVLDTYRRHEGLLTIGIDGLAGAGKSHLADCLADRLRGDQIPVTLLRLDELITPKACRYGTGQEEWFEYMYLQWDVKQLELSLFQPLQEKKRQLTLPYYDPETDKIVYEQLQLSASGILIIEGIFLQRPEWQHKLDLTVYLDCPPPVRKRRALKRDAYIGTLQERLRKYTHRYWPAEACYLRTCRPKQRADIVVLCEAQLS